MKFKTKYAFSEPIDTALSIELWTILALWLSLNGINQISIFNPEDKYYVFLDSWFAWILCIKKDKLEEIYKNEYYIFFCSLYLIFQIFSNEHVLLL